MRLKEGYDYFDAFKLMCQYYYSLMEGDDSCVDEAQALMKRHGFIDEDGERIEDED